MRSEQTSDKLIIQNHRNISKPFIDSNTKATSRSESDCSEVTLCCCLFLVKSRIHPYYSPVAALQVYLTGTCKVTSQNLVNWICQQCIIPARIFGESRSHKMRTLSQGSEVIHLLPRLAQPGCRMHEVQIPKWNKPPFGAKIPEQNDWKGLARRRHHFH